MKMLYAKVKKKQFVYMHILSCFELVSNLVTVIYESV